MKHKNVRKVGYGPVFQAVSAITSIASFMGQKKATKKAEEAQNRQADLTNRLNERNAQRQRIQQAREARIKRSQILTSTTGAGLGVTGTSSSVGGIGAVTSQENTNVSNINTNLGFSKATGQAQTDYYGAMGEAQGWKDLGAASGSIFSMSGGFDTIKNFSWGSSNSGGSSGGSTPAFQSSAFWGGK